MSIDSKDIPMETKTVRRKWYSMGYTPSWTLCPSCEKSIGWWPLEERCRLCGQRLIWKKEE